MAIKIFREGYIIMILYLSMVHICGRTNIFESEFPYQNTFVKDTDEVGVHPFTLTRQSKSRHARNADCLDLRCRSLCPWKWVTDSKEGRVPRFITKAQCLNQTCNYDFGKKYIGNKARRILEALSVCELVYTDIKVIQNGEMTYIPWPVACACSQSKYKPLQRRGHEMVKFDENSMVSEGII